MAVDALPFFCELNEDDSPVGCAWQTPDEGFIGFKPVYDPGHRAERGPAGGSNLTHIARALLAEQQNGFPFCRRERWQR